MARSVSDVPEVFSLREIARAAGASSGDVAALLASGAVSSSDGAFVASREAVRAVRLLKGLSTAPQAERQLFRPLTHTKPGHSGSLTVSGLLHATAFGIALMTVGVSSGVVEP